MNKDCSEAKNIYFDGCAKVKVLLYHLVDEQINVNVFNAW